MTAATFVAELALVHAQGIAIAIVIAIGKGDSYNSISGVLTRLARLRWPARFLLLP